MTSQAFAAQGTTLSINSTPVAELKNIRGPAESANLIDVTSHDSPGAYREVISGFLSGGEVSIDGNFLPGDDGQAALHAALQGRSLEDFTITLPLDAGSVICAFSGIATAFEPNFPFDSEASFSATITVSGAPTWSWSAGT